MSLIFLDGFDDYAVAGDNLDAPLQSAGYAYAQRTSCSNDTPTGIGRSLRLFNTVPGNCSVDLPTGDVADLIVGGHVKLPNEPASSIMAFYNEDTLGAIRPQAMVILNAQRGVTICDVAQSIAYAASAPALMYPGVWYYFEVRVNHATGRMTVRLNEDTVIADVVVPLGSLGSTNIVRLVGADTGQSTFKYWDNLYVLDADVGTAPFNDFLGEVAVFTGRAQSDAGPNEMALVGTTGPEHYKGVDDDFYNDGDYLVAATPGLDEWFTMTDMPTDTLQVYAVVIATRIRKGSGPARYQNSARIGASVLTMPDKASSASFTTYIDILNEKPGGGTWSITDANAVQIGIASFS